MPEERDLFTAFHYALQNVLQNSSPANKHVITELFIEQQRRAARSTARADAAEAEAAALTARVAELEEHLTGDIQAVTSDGQQHRIQRGNWRPYPASLLE